MAIEVPTGRLPLDPIAHAIMGWDSVNWALALSYWRKHSRVRLAGCKALEIGARGGGLSLWLALQGAEVVCSDLVHPAEHARPLHAAYGVEQRVEYRALDCLQLAEGDRFDVIAFKSVLGGVGRGGEAVQREALQRMHKALRPGGELMFAENLAGSPLHRWMRKRFVTWNEHWRYLTRGEFERMLSPFAELHLREAGVLGALGRTETQRRALGYLDRLALNWIVPRPWQYIAIGIARK